jgi:hypothetical protein
VSLAVHPSGRIDQVAIASDLSIWHRWASTFAGLNGAVWESLNGAGYAASCAWSPDGTVFLVAVHGTDDRLWEATWTTKTGWNPFIVSVTPINLRH